MHVKVSSQYAEVQLSSKIYTRLEIQKFLAVILRKLFIHAILN